MVRREVKIGWPGIGGILGTADDRYGGLDSSFFDNEHGVMDIYIGNDGIARIKNIVIPAPKLTYTFSPFNENKSITYGVAIREGQTIKFDTDIKIDTGKTLSQALESCRTNYFWNNINLISELIDYTDCIASYLNVDKATYLSYLELKLKNDKLGGGCKIKERFLFIEWDAIDSTCIMNTAYSSRISKRINIPIPHAQVLFYGNEVEMTDKRITCSGEECKKEWWTYSPQDKIEVHYGMDVLPVGSKIKAKLKVYTDNAINFDAFGKNYSIASSEMWGRESEFSNELEIKNAPKLQCETSSFKLPYPGGQSHTITQDWQNPGGSHHPGSYHNQWALDFDHTLGSPVAAMAGGTVKKVVRANIDRDPTFCSSKYADQVNYIAIDHGNGNTTIYLHLKQYSNQVNEGDVVKQGQLIAYSGNSGYVCGYHLHVTNQDSSTVKASGFGASIPMNFSDGSVCNNVYKGVPQYFRPGTSERDYFISDNY